MHEQSLVRTILAQVEQLAADHGASAVEEVVVTVGALAGVEPLLLSGAFEMLATGDIFRRAKLTIELEPLVLACASCSETFEPSGFAFACRCCGSGETRAVRGEGVILRNVALRLCEAEEVRA
jgi:hydrogenase nickel incorporation protein HypA/HybF